MSDDDAKRDEKPTVPPPPGEEDAYSASTLVGQASAELLALIRSPEDGATAPSEPLTKEAALMAAAAKEMATKQAAAKEAAAKEAAAKEAAAKEAAAKATPSPERLAPTGPPQKPVVLRSSNAPLARPHDESADGAGLPPALAIILVFAAASGVLLALVR